MEVGIGWSNLAGTVAVAGVLLGLEAQPSERLRVLKAFGQKGRRMKCPNWALFRLQFP